VKNVNKLIKIVNLIVLIIITEYAEIQHVNVELDGKVIIVS